MSIKYLILGAGPSGLSFAASLLMKGESSFLVIEKESVPGGLCRSLNVDNAPLDIGGGHFLDVRRPKVNEFLFRFLPKNEWNLFERDSRIDIGGKLVGHPLEANIWQMDLQEQVSYLKSIAAAGCNTGQPMPDRFVDWIYWKLGERIAQDYMIPYNSKMFGENLDSLGTYWLEKLPNVSFEETLMSCLTRKAYGRQPGHAQFYYPKNFGYGEVWLRIAETLKGRILYDTEIIGLDLETQTVTAVGGLKYSADRIISTIPWTEFSSLSGLPDGIREGIDKLKYSSVQVDYIPENLDTEAQWIYCPAPELPYHRILLRNNFCPGSRGYWTETNPARGEKSNGVVCYSYTSQYAYPHNTVGKQEFMQGLLRFAETRNIYGLGRWGEWEHYNSDMIVEKAIILAEKMLAMPT